MDYIDFSILKNKNFTIKSIFKNKISNREPIGIQVAQCIASAIIQETLSSYHNVGLVGKVIDGIKRYKDLTEYSIKNIDSSCIVYLRNNNINPYRFIYNIFDDFIICFKCICVDGLYKLYIKMDKKKMNQYKLSLNELINILNPKFSELYSFVDIILLPEKFYTIIIILDDIKEINIIKKMYICGIQNIINIKLFNDKLSFLTIGSNLSCLLAYENVNSEKTISNNIDDVYMTLGIESARKVFIQELSNVLNLDINNPNILFIADSITIKGIFTPINSNGVNKMLPDLIVNMTNEKTKTHIKSNIPFGSNNINETISEQAITGSLVKIGSGAVNVYETGIIRIICYLEDINKIVINENYLRSIKVPVNLYKRIQRPAYDDQILF